MMAQIELLNVIKDYKIRKRDEARSKWVEFFAPQYVIKRAVDNISFTIDQGEMVGYIGSNGAGKSTTIKMLTGILLPTHGKVRVLGSDPCKNRAKNALHMGAVFGQRSQLLWDLPVRDTFELFKTMYRIEKNTFARQRDMLVHMLDMEGFLDQAVRQLSLGQRMRANLALCFLHQPMVVYLDEPTIGLDVLVKDKIRSFLKEINKQYGTTVLLTTHDTQDIIEIAQRLMLIDKGRLLFDGEQEAFKATYRGKDYLIEVTFTENTDVLDFVHFKANKVEGRVHSYWIPYDKMNPGAAISQITAKHPIMDIKLKESDIEDILKQLYDNV